MFVKKSSMSLGRPLKFKTIEELQSKIDEYFKITPAKEITITGLAIHLDTTRDLLCDYEDKELFSDTIKKAKLRVHHEYEKDLRRMGRSGDIFALKNFGWKDKREMDVGENLKELLTYDQATQLLNRRRDKGLSDISERGFD